MLDQSNSTIYENVSACNGDNARTSATPIISVFGNDLTGEDYASIETRWIPRGLADEAGLRRVTSLVGQQMFNRKRGDFAGIIFPYIRPNETYPHEYRLRRDTPDLEAGLDGSTKERNKYISPPGRPNLVYFPPGLTTALLADINIPAILTEGEFKTLAMWRLSNHNSTSPRFMPVGFGGVWNFRGTIGKKVGPNGDRRDVTGIIPDVERITWKGRRVIIAFDADAEEKPQVRAARWRLTSALIERGATVGLLEWPIEEGKGIDDWLVKGGPEKVLAEIEKVTFGDWRTRLLRSENGKLLPCYDNTALMLENSPEWAGVLGYNQFTGGHFILKTPPPPITTEQGKEIEDHFDTEVVRWLERRGVMVKPDLVRRVVDGIARKNSYHPVVDYLESLPPWDGIPRINTWLLEYCGVQSSDENPNHFAMAAGEKFLISAVARVMDPGCKVDHLLVLEGDQGIGKSTVPRILAGDDYFSDQLADMGSKDAAMQLRGVWIMELAELEALNRSETARAKAFFTQQTERFRLPYGHRVVDIPRQCVFIGTTNSDTWNKDETGGRRYWPVRCRSLNLDALRHDRDQLWAEALHAYRCGRTWWLEDAEIIKEAVEEQRGRYVEDVWQEKVMQLAAEQAATPEAGADSKYVPRGYTAIPEILSRLGMEMAKQDQAAANRVARCLKAGKWERYQKRKEDGTREWRYRPVKRGE
jgi:hypothetical protein